MMLKTKEMERHIEWADKLFDIIKIDVKELGLISRITNENIIKWKQWGRENEFICKKD